jgi:hypothetical protein
MQASLGWTTAPKDISQDIYPWFVVCSRLIVLFNNEMTTMEIRHGKHFGF